MNDFHDEIFKNINLEKAVLFSYFLGCKIKVLVSKTCQLQ